MPEHEQADTLSAYVPQDRREALARDTVLPDRGHGAALMADISGFTPLTEALAQTLGPRRGAEELARQLNRVYDALIAEVDRWGGSVLGFAGDAITCWLEGTGPDPVLEAAHRAAACGLAMQCAMARAGAVTVGPDQTVTLSMKIGAGAGTVRRFLVGRSDIQTIDVLAGTPVDRMAAAEHLGRPGDVILDGQSALHLGGALQVVEWRTSTDTAQHFAVVSALTEEPRSPQARDLARLTPEQARGWLLPPVYERLRSGQGEFLSELRPAVALFLRFGGIDFEEDDAAGAKLDAYVRWVQGVLAQHNGSLVQLTIGDKGSYLYAAFGAPVAHEDDAGDAVAAALELRASADVLQGAHRTHGGPAAGHGVPEVQIGISRGRMRVGAYGGTQRRTYGVLGDEVNLAARLMQRAAPGQILLSQHVAEAVEKRCALESIGLVSVKGKARPIPVFALAGQGPALTPEPAALFPRPPVGRGAELAQLAETLEAALEGHGRVIRVQGAAGMGKSHLVAEFAQQARARGLRTAASTCQSAAQSTPYLAWRQALQALLGLTDLATAGAQRAALPEQELTQFVARIEQFHPEWLARLPLLGEILELPIPDTPLTLGLDPRLRQDARSTLVTEIVLASAEIQPLLLVFEDSQWMDEASLALALAVGRGIADAPVVLLLVHRTPAGQDLQPLPELDGLPFSLRIDLQELNPDGVAALVEQRLQGAPEPLLLGVLHALAQGNPFFLDGMIGALRVAGGLATDAAGRCSLSAALVESLRDTNCLVANDDDGWQLAAGARLSAVSLGLPDSIYSVVLARLDRLPDQHKLTLKVASVIGQSFDLAPLQRAHPLQPTPAALSTQLSDLANADFVRAEAPAGDSAYRFEQNITREVAYETLLYDQRKQLHRAVAHWYEQTHGGFPREAVESQDAPPTPLAPYYDLLTFHWRLAEDAAHEQAYAMLAGEQAAARFANEQAVRHLTRALELTPAEGRATRYRLLLTRERVSDLRGDREAQACDLAALAVEAEALGDAHRQSTLALRQANYARMVSDYPAALRAAEQAVEHATRCGDEAAVTEGHLMAGRVCWQQGSHNQAREHLGHALRLAEQAANLRAQGEALYYLGMVDYHQGNAPAAEQHDRRALALYREAGYLEGEARCLGQLAIIRSEAGDYSSARDYYEEALARYHAIGHRRGETIALGALGADNLDLGDFPAARHYLELSLRIRREIGDRWGEALSLDTLGLVYESLGDHATARQLCAEAVAIQEGIGDRHGTGYSLTHLGQTLAGLQEYAAAAEAFSRALQLRRDLGEPALAIDDLAGLAQAALSTGDGAHALDLASEISRWIEANGIAGIEYPLPVLLTCYHVFRAQAETDMRSRARETLRAAHGLLQERAARIQDPILRGRFLNNIPSHQALVSAWAAGDVA